jgi:hypothetical protein
MAEGTCQQDGYCFAHRKKRGWRGDCPTCSAQDVPLLKTDGFCAACFSDRNPRWFCKGTDCMRASDLARSRRPTAADAAPDAEPVTGAARATPAAVPAPPELQATLAAQRATVATHEASLAALQENITQLEARLAATEAKNRQLEGMVQDLQRTLQTSVTELQVAIAAAVAGLIASSSHDWDSSRSAGWSGRGTWDEGTGGGAPWADYDPSNE